MTTKLHRVPKGLNEVYAYDSFGNILQNGSFNSSYTANNQMFGYAYDASGNLLSDGLHTMTWDAESRISQVGGATYIYDAEGNRVETQGVGVTDTIYFGGKPIARLSGGQWTDLIYGPTGLLAEVPGTQTGAPMYRVTDHLGTTVGNLQANGTFINPLDSSPFGRTISGNTSDPYQFTGKERDAESGLDYFGARYYASNMGRWMSPDWADKPEAVPYSKLDNPQSLNLYGYVGNNPLSQIDNDGHDIIFADNLLNAQLVKDTVSAILANPNTSSYLSGYVGPNSPNLTIQSGDLGPPTVQVLPSGQTLTTTVQGNTKPDITTGTPEIHNGVEDASGTKFNGATITIDNNTSKGDTPGVMIHEGVHAGEAQQNPAKFAADAKAEAGQPHDSRPQEQRANAVRAANEKQIKQQVKKIEKDRKKDQP